MPTLSEVYALHPFWVWLAMGGALLAIEVATGSGWLLWPAASAAVVALAALVVGLSLPMSVFAFAILTIVSTLLARRYMPRSVNTAGHDINDNVARLMGHEGKVVAAFRGHVGRVFIDGKEWAADLDGAETLEAGARVEVVGVAGARLTVRAA